MHRPITPPVQFEILDLRHFSANSLRAVLDQEVRVWNERLQWNYRASADLLLQYLDSRILPGYVAMEDGRVTGYVFCVYEENKAVIGDAFAIPKRQGGHSANEIELRLLDHVIDLLINSPGIDRSNRNYCCILMGRIPRYLSGRDLKFFPGSSWSEISLVPSQA